MIDIALYEPEIPPNTGNIIRLCANLGAQLHLIHPLGFEVSDKRLRRAGLDYVPMTQISQHEHLEAFLDAIDGRRLLACSTRSSLRYDQCRYRNDDVLLFGPETRGLPQGLLDDLPPERRLRIPMQPQNRSLNLSNAVAVIAYEAWRQLDYCGSVPV